MGLFKKKKPQDDEPVVRGVVAEDSSREADVIDREMVAKAEQAGKKKSQSDAGYNWTNVRRLKKGQIVAIILAVVVMIVCIFFTGSINNARTSTLSGLQSQIAGIRNQIATLQTTTGVVEDTTRTESSYHNYTTQSVDDVRVTDLLNSLMRWQTSAERNAKQTEAASLPNVSNLFLALFFSSNIDYAGYTYNEDLTIAQETDAVSNFTSYMTSMTDGSRTYNALLDYTYGSADGQIYTKMVMLSYTIYDSGTTTSVSNLTAYDMMTGAQSENVITVPAGDGTASESEVPAETGTEEVTENG